MATKNDNVFASPWNDSDMVLVVEDQELHVHKWILTSHSPVFKAMFDGDFKEAGQDKVTLKEKNLKPMVQFLKIMYPPSMFGEAKAPLNHFTRLSILTLAEEYQCVNLIKLCIDEVKITAENVLQILPYAAKYHQTALPRMYEVINWSAPTSKLEKVLPEIEVKETSNKMLLTKCRFLESAVVKMQDAIVSLISDFMEQKKIADDTKASLQKSMNDGKINQISMLPKRASLGCIVSNRPTPVYGNYTYGNTPQVTIANSRCPHNIGVLEICATKSCLNCKETYKEKFLAPIPSCKNTQMFFDMLQSGDDVATAINGPKPRSFAKAKPGFNRI